MCPQQESTYAIGNNIDIGFRIIESGLLYFLGELSLFRGKGFFLFVGDSPVRSNNSRDVTSADLLRIAIIMIITGAVIVAAVVFLVVCARRRRRMREAGFDEEEIKPVEPNVYVYI